MSRCVDEHRGRFGVEPICRTLGVSASAYYQRKTGQRSHRRMEDKRLLARIGEIHAANYYAYGSRRMWVALRRAGEPIARCTVERLMRCHGIQGAKRRGKPWRTWHRDQQGKVLAKDQFGTIGLPFEGFSDTPLDTATRRPVPLTL